jgi:hypothetical protein
VFGKREVGCNNPDCGATAEAMTIALYGFLAIIGCAVMLVACDDNSQGEKELAGRRAAEELALMRDGSRAGPEIERRLRERIQSNGSIVLIKDKPGQFGSLQAVPATVAWRAICSAGLWITLAPPGEQEGLNLEISDAFLDEEDCKRLLPLAATKVVDILGGK